MCPDPEAKLLFGDILAMARERWVRAMARRLGTAGFHDYRRSDPLVLRSLRRGEVPLGNFAASLDLTRQGARKVVSGLVERDYARVTSSKVDSRRRMVELTPRGREYLDSVMDAVRDLNDEVVAHVEQDQLAAAYSVLEFIKDNIAVPRSPTTEPAVSGEL